MSEILEELFNSQSRARLLKFFFRNQKKHFRVSQISDKIQVDYYAARREVIKLEEMGLLKQDKDQKYFLASDFSFLHELENLILRCSPISKERISEKLEEMGGFKLVLLSGVFVGNEDARVDLLLVGSNFDQSHLDNFLKSLEAEVGKELDYVIMEPDEFQYRRKMFDKFVLEILEGPKEVLVDRLSFGPGVE